MSHLPSRRLLAAGAMAMLLMGTACTRVRDHKGYVVDSTLIETVRPGVDNRDSVMKVLGRPSFASDFDRGNSWYYWSRETRALAFANPRPVQQMLLEVTFDAAGNVAAVQKTGLETVMKIHPAGGRTPTLGRNRSFLSELFGNIGRVGGAGQAGGTADNPQ